MALRICIFNIFLKLGQVILLWKHFFFLFSCKYLTGTLRKKKSNFFPSIICKLKAQTKELNQRGVCCESFDSLCKHWCVVGWVMRLPLHFWASPLAQGVSAMEGLWHFQCSLGVSAAVAAVQGTVVGRKKTTLASFLFSFSDETIFSPEDSSGREMFWGCWRVF